MTKPSSGGREDSVGDVAPAPPAATPDGPFVSATHAVLFEEQTPTCDICGEALEPCSEDEEDLRPTGLYMWSRGGEVRFEQPPLCASCATAIGVTALHRWEIEEEEG